METLTRSLLTLMNLMAILVLTTFSSCGDEDPIPIIADLGTDQNVNNGDVVTISLANSSGPEGTVFNLEYAIAPLDPNGVKIEIQDTNGNIYGESQTIFSTDDTSRTFSFTAKSNGTYFFRLESGSASSQISVTVAGPIVITNDNLAEHLTLVDQNSGNSNVTDYLIAEVLNVTDQSWVFSSDVQVEVAADAGIILTNSIIESTSLLNSLTGDNWKGILIKNGSSVRFEFLTMSNTGTNAIEGFEPALITVEDGGLIGLRNSVLASDATGVILSDNAAINPTFIMAGNAFNMKDGLHCNVFQSELVVGNGVGIEGSTMTIQGMGDTFLATGDGNYSLQAGAFDVYFKGGITMSDFSIIQLSEGKEVLFEENTGLVLSQGGRIFASGSGGAILKGMNDASWNGILISGINGSWLQNVEISGAGGNAHTLSNGIASSLYVTGRLDLVENVTVSDGESYGFYFTGNTSIQANQNSLEDISFSNMADAAISGPVNKVSDFMIGSNYDFGSNPTVPAVKVRAPSQQSLNDVIFNDLGGDHYYLVEENLNFTSSSVLLLFRAGANLKFENTSLYIGSGTIGKVTIDGTASDPVVMTAADESIGWGGCLPWK